MKFRMFYKNVQKNELLLQQEAMFGSSEDQMGAMLKHFLGQLGQTVSDTEVQ